MRKVNGRETRLSSAPSWPLSWRTARRCATCSSGSRITRPADLSVPALASQASLSPRQFARAFAAEVGMTPGRYVDRVRLETARQRLEDTTDGVEQTARACGYGTPEAMRRAFMRTLGVSPGEYRRRFRPASAIGWPAASSGRSARYRSATGWCSTAST